VGDVKSVLLKPQRKKGGEKGKSGDSSVFPMGANCGKRFSYMIRILLRLLSIMKRGRGGKRGESAAGKMYDHYSLLEGGGRVDVFLSFRRGSSEDFSLPDRSSFGGRKREGIGGASRGSYIRRGSRRAPRKTRVEEEEGGVGLLSSLRNGGKRGLAIVPSGREGGGGGEEKREESILFLRWDVS